MGRRVAFPGGAAAVHSQDIVHRSGTARTARLEELPGAEGAVNIRRGLFRLWFVLCVVWVLGCAWLAFQLQPGVVDPVKWAEQRASFTAECKSDPQPQSIACKMADLFERLPMPITSIEQQQSAIAYHYGKWATVAIGGPLGVLFVGGVVGWIARGFRRDPPRSRARGDIQS